MKKIITVVGARPQFIKAAPLSRELRKEFVEILIHTGQHYDDEMSDQFFRDLEIPLPDYNLGVGSETHGIQTAKMLGSLESILLKEMPDAVLVYGDTNSTLAGALAAVKLHIPIFHVESGLRSYNRAMPEEHNRVLTDHMSDLLFCPTEAAVTNLKKEGIISGVCNVGDVMADSIRLFCFKSFDSQGGLTSHQLLHGRSTKSPEKIDSSDYYLSTIHRAENTDDPVKLQRIFDFLDAAKANVIITAHPRLQLKLECVRIPSNVMVVKPQGYLQMLSLINGALGVITDSGGLQKEAYILKKKCITLRSETEWVETLKSGWNVLVDPAKSTTEDMTEALNLAPTDWTPLYGTGHASEHIVENIRNWFKNNQ